MDNRLSDKATDPDPGGEVQPGTAVDLAGTESRFAGYNQLLLGEGGNEDRVGIEEVLKGVLGAKDAYRRADAESPQRDGRSSQERQQARARRGGHATKLMTVEIPLNVYRGIKRVASERRISKTGAFIALVNEGLTRQKDLVIRTLDPAEARALVVRNPEPTKAQSLFEYLLSRALLHRKLLETAPLALRASYSRPVQVAVEGHDMTTADLCSAYITIFQAELPFACCSVWFWQGENLVAFALAGFKEAFRNLWYVRSQKAVTLTLATTGEPIWGSAEELKKRPDFTGRCEHYLEKPPWRNFLGLPLILDGQIIGCVKLENKDEAFGPVTLGDARLAYEISRRFLVDYTNVEATIVKCCSKRMSEALEQCCEIANASEPVLLVGLDGVGKQRIARYMHNVSQRRLRPFKTIACQEIAVNSSLSEELIKFITQSQFVNGSDEFSALFKEASHGTVYFDNLTGLTPKAQYCFPKLVGRLREELNIRVIASVPRRPDDLVAQAKLDPNVPALFVATTIHMPSLHERARDEGGKEDIELLVRHIGEELHFKKGGGVPPDRVREQAKEFAPQLRRELIDNKRHLEVRDLKSICEHAWLPHRRFQDQTLQEALNELFGPTDRPASVPFQRLNKSEKEEVIRRLWEERMKGEGWTGSRVAQHLGVQQRTVQKYLTLLKLRSPRSIGRQS